MYGSYTTTQPAANWKDNNFNDSSWKKIKVHSVQRAEPTAKNRLDNRKYLARRHIVLDEDVQGKTNLSGVFE